MRIIYWSSDVCSSDLLAASFGIDFSRLRLTALLRISLLAALAVSFVGIIGFVGLVAPHIARRLFGEDHRFYLPGSALVGGVILSLASIASKNIVPGIIIPVGIVTSLVGVPFFLKVGLLVLIVLTPCWPYATLVWTIRKASCREEG